MINNKFILCGLIIIFILILYFISYENIEKFNEKPICTDNVDDNGKTQSGEIKNIKNYYNIDYVNMCPKAQINKDGPVKAGCLNQEKTPYMGCYMIDTKLKKNKFMIDKIINNSNKVNDFNSCVNEKDKVRGIIPRISNFKSKDINKFSCFKFEDKLKPLHNFTRIKDKYCESKKFQNNRMGGFIDGKFAMALYENNRNSLLKNIGVVDIIDNDKVYDFFDLNNLEEMHKDCIFIGGNFTIDCNIDSNNDLDYSGNLNRIIKDYSMNKRHIILGVNKGYGKYSITDNHKEYGDLSDIQLGDINTDINIDEDKTKLKSCLKINNMHFRLNNEIEDQIDKFFNGDYDSSTIYFEYLEEDDNQDIALFTRSQLKSKREEIRMSYHKQYFKNPTDNQYSPDYYYFLRMNNNKMTAQEFNNNNDSICCYIKFSHKLYFEKPFYYLEPDSYDDVISLTKLDVTPKLNYNNGRYIMYIENYEEGGVNSKLIRNRFGHYITYDTIDNKFKWTINDDKKQAFTFDFEKKNIKTKDDIIVSIELNDLQFNKFEIFEIVENTKYDSKLDSVFISKAIDNESDDYSKLNFDFGVFKNQTYKEDINFKLAHKVIKNYEHKYITKLINVNPKIFNGGTSTYATENIIRNIKYNLKYVNTDQQKEFDNNITVYKSNLNSKIKIYFCNWLKAWTDGMLVSVEDFIKTKHDKLYYEGNNVIYKCLNKYLDMSDKYISRVEKNNKFTKIKLNYELEQGGKLINFVFVNIRTGNILHNTSDRECERENYLTNIKEYLLTSSPNTKVKGEFKLRNRNNQFFSMDTGNKRADLEYNQEHMVKPHNIYKQPDDYTEKMHTKKKSYEDGHRFRYSSHNACVYDKRDERTLRDEKGYIYGNLKKQYDDCRELCKNKKYFSLQNGFMTPNKPEGTHINKKAYCYCGNTINLPDLKNATDSSFFYAGQEKYIGCHGHGLHIKSIDESDKIDFTDHDFSESKLETKKSELDIEYTDDEVMGKGAYIDIPYGSHYILGSYGTNYIFNHYDVGNIRGKIKLPNGYDNGSFITYNKNGDFKKYLEFKSEYMQSDIKTELSKIYNIGTDYNISDFVPDIFKIGTTYSYEYFISSRDNLMFTKNNESSFKHHLKFVYNRKNLYNKDSDNKMNEDIYKQTINNNKLYYRPLKLQDNGRLYQDKNISVLDAGLHFDCFLNYTYLDVDNIFKIERPGQVTSVKKREVNGISNKSLRKKFKSVKIDFERKTMKKGKKEIHVTINGNTDSILKLTEDDIAGRNLLNKTTIEKGSDKDFGYFFNKCGNKTDLRGNLKIRNIQIYNKKVNYQKIKTNSNILDYLTARDKELINDKESNNMKDISNSLNKDSLKDFQKEVSNNNFKLLFLNTDKDSLNIKYNSDDYKTEVNMKCYY